MICFPVGSLDFSGAAAAFEAVHNGSVVYKNDHQVFLRFTASCRAFHALTRTQVSSITRLSFFKNDLYMSFMPFQRPEGRCRCRQGLKSTPYFALQQR